MFGSDPLDELSIPDGTHVQEHFLVTDEDVIVGGQSAVELGVRGRNVMAGERVSFGGDVEADGDCRLDMWCDVDGNVLVGQDAYLGERVHVAGQLVVSGDLDIGDDVDIERGFEANGWIVIRNPMPTIVFLFVYLSQLLRIGEEEAAEAVVDEFLAGEGEADPLSIPRGARVSDDAWRVSTPATIGDDCRLHGNIRATEIDVGQDTEVFGSLRARSDVAVGPGTVVHGDVTTKDGDVVVGPRAHVRGDISCEDCQLSETAEVDGTIRARGQLVFADAPEPGGTGADEGGDPRETVSFPDDLTPAIVPVAESDNAVPEPEPAFVPVDQADSDVEPSAAVRPVDESEFDWASAGATEVDPSTNGAAEDVETIIADAEDG